MPEFAAHIREDGTIQSVEEHSRATAALAEKYARSVGMEKMAYLQGLIHDYGKLCADFSDYICGRNSMRRGQIDHSFAGAEYLQKLAEQTGDPRIIDTAFLAARTVVSHHGLHDWLNESGEDVYLQRISKQERYAEIRENARRMVSDEELMQLLQQAMKEYGAVRRKIAAISPGREYQAFYLGMLERLLESILMDADRTDTASFMSAANTEMFCDAQKLWDQMEQRMTQKCDSFRSRTDPISRQRMSISDRCAAFAHHPIGACRLIVPTGGGKTLASLRLAIEYCREYGMERIFYTAPFMTILEQNSDEIRAIAGEESFLEHHSNVQQELDGAEELEAYELRADHWDSRVIATTQVQLFNTLFSGKSTSVRRMHRLCRSVIIFDEVQSIPLKCVSLFNLAVNFLTKVCGCAVILCSATQPCFEATQYPMLLDQQESVVGDCTDDFIRFRRTELIGALRDAGYSMEEAASFCVEKFQENGNLLVVVNTKAAAAGLFEKLRQQTEQNIAVIHLSTNMCPQHRRETIADMRRLLKEEKPLICVTTCLIEAGIDISFHCVVRSLAGMDNAAQAAGRCNRHGENPVCPVYVINLAAERLNNLQQIKTAQKISRQIIGSMPEQDLLAPEVMSLYFQKLYQENGRLLNYPVQDAGTGTTLIDLLAENRHRYGLHQQGIQPYCQAFATAGRLFEVIDSRTEDILVPYNTEAEELIARLNEVRTPGEAAGLLRKAQKYIVQIYPQMKTTLNEEGARYELKCGGVAALKKEFYDPAFGIRSGAGQPEIFMQ
ncbi:MAG: CRISPR-associated helicase Cas3' [Firmicutes bacterium]|nr:CRISPR-associated helicase Cas3' [Bacillota bacterium]